METLAQVYSYEFCEISKITLYTEHLRTTASACVIKSLGKAINGGDGLGMKIPCRLLFFCGGKVYKCLQIKTLYAIIKLFSKIYTQNK